MDHWRNQRGNQKILRDKLQWRYNSPKPMGHSKTTLRGEFIAIKSYLNKEGKAQISNLTLHITQSRKDRQGLKLAEGKKS